MKKLFLILLAVSLTGNFNYTFSQASEMVKYLPLNTGNVWVYYMTGGNFMGNVTCMDRYTLTGVIEANGKFYYSVGFYRRVISGNEYYGCTSRLFRGNYAIRVDSSTGNIYRNVICDSYEALVDSLNSRLNDISQVCSFSSARCSDTNQFFIFGSNKPSKRFYVEGFEIYDAQRYVKNIGLVQYNTQALMTSCAITLRGCVIDGVLYGDTSMLVGINQISSEVPESFSLSQNYPNPFNPTTNIKFQIAKSGFVKMIVYNALGKEIKNLVNQQLQPGTYEADFDASNLPSGVYYYRMETEGFTQTKKMVLIK